MSILTEPLEKSVVVRDVRYPINTDFRVWMEFDNVVNSAEIKAESKTEILFRICFDKAKCKVLPESRREALCALYDFYVQKKGGKSGGKEKRVFSFEEDAGYIYAAFLAQYNIDLLSVPYMHWYVFCALLNGLEENSRLMKIIALRSVNTAEIADKNRKQAYARLQKIYALGDKRSDEEKEREAAEILMQAM